MNIKYYTAVGCLFVGINGMAQTLSGNLNAGAGVGEASPWTAGLKLNIHTQKLEVKPFVELTGISKKSSSWKEDMDYVYSSSGNRYHSEKETTQKGRELKYGVEAAYKFDDFNKLSASVELGNKNIEIMGTRYESLTASNGELLSSVTSRLSDPESKDKDLNVAVGFEHKTHVQGEALHITYNYERQRAEEEMKQDVTAQKNFNILGYSLYSDSKIRTHKMQIDWLRPIARGQVLGAGVRYEDRLITSESSQWYFTPGNGGAVNSFLEDFHHKMQTGGVFMNYGLNLKPFSIQARLEYDYTKMQEKKLNDLIPTFMARWNMDKSNSLQFNYVRRIIRPTLSYLFPAHVLGPYTVDYGNEDLIGTHVNIYSLVFTSQKTDKFTFHTTFQHIAANDGFNAMWMEKDNIRISTWGNMGIRRAWSVAPDMVWKPAAGTQIDGKVTVLWDKRIAEAIHMAKEHWGITTQLNLQQKLPMGLQLRAGGEYSEGNTADLYSHYSKSVSFNGSLQRAFGPVMVALQYRYTDHPYLKLTQGAYTGILFARPEHEHAASLSLNYKF